MTQLFAVIRPITHLTSTEFAKHTETTAQKHHLLHFPPQTAAELPEQRTTLCLDVMAVSQF